MAKTSPPNVIDLVNVPTYFADQPAGLLVGAHVSRLTFGVQEDDDSNYPRPVVTVAIPTTALLDLVSDLRLILDDENFKLNVSKQLAASTKKLTSGLKPTMSVNMERPRALKKPAAKKKATSRLK